MDLVTHYSSSLASLFPCVYLAGSQAKPSTETLQRAAKIRINFFKKPYLKLTSQKCTQTWNNYLLIVPCPNRILFMQTHHNLHLP